MNEKEKQMVYIAKQIYKLAKEISPETTFLNIAINERGEDGTPYNTVHIHNNYWESKVNTIEIWEELK